MADRIYPELRQWIGTVLSLKDRFPGWALTRGTTLLVFATLSALILVGTLTVRQTRSLVETTYLATHSHQVLSELSAVRSMVDLIPSTARGYALTGQRQFQAAFEVSLRGLESKVEHLRYLTRDNVLQQKEIDKLKRQIESRIDFGRKLIEAHDSGGAAAAGELVGSGRGEVLQAAIRETLTKMEREEDRLLHLRESASLSASNATFLLLLLGTAFSLAVLIFGVFRLNREAGAFKNAHHRATAELLESMSDGFVSFDSGWRYTRVNSAAEHLLGKSRVELLGNVLWEIFPECETLAYGTEYRRAVRDNVPVRFEEYFSEPLNVWYEVRAYPADGGLNVFFNNITQRKRTEERLRQLSRAVEQSPSVVMITDTLGHIEYANPKFTELTGYTFEEALGQNPRILNAGDSPPGQGRELWTTILAGKEWRGEFHNRKKNGELYWEYASISPILNEEGRITHFVAVKEDVTRRKMMEVSLLQAKKDAEEASRTKDIFLATLSHELRTPLTPVLFAASSAESDDALDPEVREQFRMIRNNIELESRLIDDLLDLTKITRGKFSLTFHPISVAEPLRKTLEILRPEYLAKELDVRCEVADGAAVVRADSARLHQVFWNLLKNAIKFTPAGGKIAIRLLHPDDGTVAIEFRDSGLGIAPEHIGEIFQPFQQGAAAGKAHFGGLGLGLAITKAIVEVHGGSIRVESEGSGRGAAFTVRLPIWTGGGHRDAKPLKPEEAIRAARRILLVEDDSSTRAVLSRILRKDGHHVESAGSCAEALKVLNSQPEALPFEVLFCDVGLPDGNGLDLVGPIKERSPGIYAVALSGYGMADDIRRSEEAGFNTHLVKPVSIEEVRLTIARA